MENAVKALLIAGAVLVTILIISITMGVFNVGAEQIDNAADLSEYEIQSFNDKFEQYVGTNVSGAEVNALIKTAFNHNLFEDDANRRVRVGLDGGGQGNGQDKANGGKWLIRREQFWDNTNGLTTELETVPVGNRYTVDVDYDKNSKLIYQINITTNTNT